MNWKELALVSIPPTLAVVGIGLKVGGEVVIKVIEWLTEFRIENTFQHAKGEEGWKRVEHGIKELKGQVEATRDDVQQIDEKLDDARERLSHVEGRLDK